MNLSLVVRNVLFQLLDFVLQLPNPFLNLRLVVVRGAFPWGLFLPVDKEETARIGTSVRCWGSPAGVVKVGKMGIAPTFMYEGVIETHG